MISEEDLKKNGMSDDVIAKFKETQKLRRQWLEANLGIVVNEDGSVNGWVITQETGCQGGSMLPRESYIQECFFGSEAEEMAYTICAMMNRKTDLPYYVAEAKIKITGKEEKITDTDLEDIGFEPLD